MPERTLALNYVLSVQEDTPSRRSVVSLSRSGTLWFTDKKLAEQLWTFMAKRRVAAIEFDADARQMTNAYWPKRDWIAALYDSGPPEPLRVRARKNPTLLELPRDPARFGELYGVLREALQRRAQVAMAVYPGGRNIQDVLILPGEKD
jgi:hypothetical protein